MKIMARETNYGTRVDYILVTPGLLPWIKHGDIQPLLKGSDHCPIYIDLHDSVIDFEGRTRTLREEMQMPETEAERRAPPRIATKNWDEYSGKQKLLSNFFGKAKAKSPDSPVDSTPLEVSSPPTTIVQSGPLEADPPVAAVDATLASATIEISTQPSVDSTTPSASPDVELVPQPPNTTTTSVLARTPMKRKAPKASNPSGSDAYDAVVPKRQKGKAGIKATPSKGKGKAAQQSIATFFGKPAAKPSTQSSTSDVLVVGGDGDPNDDADYQLALKLSQETDSGIPLSQNTLATSRAADPAETKAAWSNMFAKTEAPRCPMHDEPAKAFTVNKTGPNKGRAFYVCARSKSSHIHKRSYLTLPLAGQSDQDTTKVATNDCVPRSTGDINVISSCGRAT
jgi:AP endonuclease-2